MSTAGRARSRGPKPESRAGVTVAVGRSGAGMQFWIALMLQDLYMSKPLENPAVTAETLEEVVRRILAVGNHEGLFCSDRKPAERRDRGVIWTSWSLRIRPCRAINGCRVTCAPWWVSFRRRTWWCGHRRRSKLGRECRTPSSPPLCAREKRSMPDKFELARGASFFVS